MRVSATPSAPALRRRLPLLLLAAPGVIVLLAFQYFPLLGNVIAFKHYLPFLGI